MAELPHVEKLASPRPSYSGSFMPNLGICLAAR